LGGLCLLFGITRQAYYQHYKCYEQISLEQELILQQVLKIRTEHPRIGGRKLLEMMSGFRNEHDIKMGRDALFKLLSEQGLLVKKRKKRAITTHSLHRYHKYKNIIKSFTPTHPNQLWVSDITYWKIETGFVYISLITDAYSHKVVGYHLGETLETIHCVKALKMALLTLKDASASLIHHSDRGTQYCCDDYVKLLLKSNIQISMTENGDPLENAIAERINGILKDEYLECYQVNNMKEARYLLDSVVKLYNQQRPHMSIGNLTPDTIHLAEEPITVERLWQNYYLKNGRKEVLMT
jgi:putative transposase